MTKNVGGNQYVIDFVYNAGGTLIGLNTSEGQYFYRRDITGNILGILDSNGNYVVKYRYDAWGNILNKRVIVNCIASNHNPFRYKGYVYDEETKWYYLQSRYYIPAIGRFLSPDSIDYLDEETIGGLNLYAYCNNNPVNYYDPSGTSISLVVGLLVTLALGFLTSTISQGIQYGWENINYAQSFVDGVFGMASIALAATGIGMPASIALGALLGFGQYAIDSVFHDEELTLVGSLTAIGIGAISGAISGAGAKNVKNIAKSLDGRANSGVKAIITATQRYGANSREVMLVRNLYQSAINKATKEIVNKAFTRSVFKTWIFMPFATATNTTANILIC